MHPKVATKIIAIATTWAGKSFLASKGSYFWFQIGAANGCKNQLLVTISSLANTTLEVKGVVNADAVSLSDFGKAVNGTSSSKSQFFSPHAGTGAYSAGQTTFKFNTWVSGAANGCNHTIASDTFFQHNSGCRRDFSGWKRNSS